MPTTTDTTQRRGDAIVFGIGLLSTLTLADMQAADQLWRQNAPAPARDLLHAKPVEDEDDDLLALLLGFALLRSRYQWDGDAVRYLAPTLRPVAPSAVKQAVNTFAAKTAQQAAMMTQQMTAGEITVAQWQTRMAEHVKGVHTAARVAARGGWLQIRVGDVKRLQDALAEQMEYLQRFADQVAQDAISDAKAVSQAKLYEASASPAYEDETHWTWLQKAFAGATVEVFNELGQAEHCETDPNKPDVPGCVNETRRGWVPINDINPITIPGTRRCGPNCKCRLTYRRKP